MCASANPTAARSDRAVVMTILAAALVSAVILVALVYPGWTYWDSNVRWALAESIAARGVLVDHSAAGRADLFPMLPSLIMAGLYKISGEHGLYGVVQSFALLASSLLLAWELFFRDQSHGKIGLALAGLLLILNPIVHNFSIFHAGDTLTAIALTLLGLVAAGLLRNGGSWPRIAGFAGVLGLLYGVRENTVILVPVLVGFVLLIRLQPAHRLVLLALIIGLVPTNFLLKRLVWVDHRFNQESVALAIDVVGTLRLAHDHGHDISAFDHSLDRYGDTRAAIALDQFYSRWTPAFTPGLGIDLDRTIPAAESGAIRTAFLAAVSHFPLAYLHDKLIQDLWLSGVYGRLPTLELANHLKPDAEGGWHRNPSLADSMVRHHGFIESDASSAMARSYHRFMAAAGFVTNRPIVLLAAVLGLIWLIRRRLTGVQARALGVVVAIAVVYYLSFLVLSHTNEFRYFFPSFQILITILTAATASAIVGAGPRTLAPDLPHWQGAAVPL